MSDMGRMMSGKKNDGTCFLDLVGADVDSGSFRDSLTY
jgi:hypothetical protein